MLIVSHNDAAFQFPPVDEADEEGLLVIGGKLSPAKIIEAYKQGVFPWYNKDEPVLWWTPDPRFVLFPKDLHISNSMKKILRQNRFIFKTNTAFTDVIKRCRTINRNGQDGTWITNEMEAVYTELHHLGYAHSAEAWKDDELVGGMYGIKINQVFFGESMFSNATNASKFAFINFIHKLQNEDVQLMDCQVYSNHLETLGAKFITRKNFIELLNINCQNLVSR